MKEVDLSQKSLENVTFMLKEIVTKLKMVNIEVLQPEQMNIDLYDDLKDIYELVMRKNSFSPSEMQAIVEELGRIRKG